MPRNAAPTHPPAAGKAVADKPARRSTPAKPVVMAPPAAPVKAARPARTAKAALPPEAVTKPATAPAPAPALLPVPEAGKAARAKDRLVRDSFTMPLADFALIQQLKDRALGFKRPTKKSELLRAGLQALAALPDAPLQALLDQLPALKAGRPKKGS